MIALFQCLTEFVLILAELPLIFAKSALYMILVFLESICLEIVIYSTRKLVSLHPLCFFFFLGD